MKPFFGKRGFRSGFWTAVMMFFIAAGSASAASVGVFTSSQITDWNNQYTSTGGVTIGTRAWEFSSTTPYSTDTGDYFYYTSGVHVRAAARADYGSLSAYAYKFNPTSAIEASSSAAARFSDVWTIGSSSRAGTAGHLNIWVDIKGNIAGNILHPGVSGGSSWNVQLTDSSFSAVTSWDYATNSGRQEYHGFLGQQIDFIYGQPFTVSVDFSVGAGGAFNGATGENYADYLHTLLLNMNNSQVLDATGALVDQFTLTAESGHNYLGTTPSAVPEPTTMMLLGLGLAGIAVARKKFYK